VGPRASGTGAEGAMQVPVVAGVPRHAVRWRTAANDVVRRATSRAGARSDQFQIDLAQFD
jgi:hypothetical protein